MRSPEEAAREIAAECWSQLLGGAQGQGAGAQGLAPADWLTSQLLKARERELSLERETPDGNA